MGIVEKQLACFELSTGELYNIEYTSKGDIHIHVDNIQVKMSVREFRQFIDVVLQGREALAAYKHGL